MAIIRTITEKQYTLDEVREIVRAGKAAEVFKVGDQLLVNFDGREVPYDIIGIDAERLASKELKHSITLQAAELTEERSFDTKGRYGSNCWRTSELREYLSSEEYLKRYADLVPYLAAVVKDNTDGQDTEELFFLLSKEEYEAETTPYEFYKKQKNCVKATPEGVTDWHWTRSANRGHSYYTWDVYAGGSVYYGSYAIYAIRCAPACVIA